MKWFISFDSDANGPVSGTPSSEIPSLGFPGLGVGTNCPKVGPSSWT